jgi:hypothetical protein
MSYAAWSVVFGEQPSAAKWNILGSNDASFADGTGIAADAIIDSKLVYGKLRSRQGGSATDWNTVGTTTYDYSGTNVFVQGGSIFNDASPKTITFPTAFTSKPLVMAVVSSVNATSCFAIVLAITTTTFTCQVYDNGGTTNNSQNINWVAWGQ